MYRAVFIHDGVWRAIIASCLAFQGLLPALRNPTVEGSKFTLVNSTRETNLISIVLLTIYENTFTRFIHHYEAMPFVTDILVVWNNRETGPPIMNSSFRVPVTVVLETQNTLNNRYKHANMVQNEIALLSDDDILLDSDTLQFASKFPAADPLVVAGFFPRQVSYEQNLWKYGGNGRLKNTFHMTTGRAHLLHTLWMDAFIKLPQHLLDFIDKNKPTCEDITLHFLVANTTDSRLVLVKPCRPEILRRRGMSKRTRNWWGRRSACLNRLSKTFGGMILRNNTDKYLCVDQLNGQPGVIFNRTTNNTLLATSGE